ncbi:MAG: hypothetical protein IAI50_17875 [Candidatus Eremiobacteraeota bacterium]|nr:hypothetical protein [Candidatus Eremiobacteraeota bacterium]
MLPFASISQFVGALFVANAIVSGGLLHASDALADPSPSPSSAATGLPDSAATSSPVLQNPNSKSGVPVTIPAHRARTDYTPSIDVIPQSTFATGADYTQGEPDVQGSIKIGGKISESLIGNLNFSYQHGYIDETVGNAPNPGNYLVNDPTDDFRLNYPATKSCSVAIGYFYRHRTCCPAAGQNGNAQPITVHDAYAEADYAFPAIAALNGATFSITARGTKALAHKPAPAAYLAANTNIGPDEGDKFLPSGGVTLSVPVDKKNGFSVFGTYSYVYDYFDYEAIPWFYNIVDYGFTRVVSPTFSFTVDSTNLHEHLEGNPFPGLNVIHRAKVVLSADLRLGRH